MTRRDFAAVLAASAATLALGSTPAQAGVERGEVTLRPVLELRDYRGRVVGYSNRDFVDPQATVIAYGETMKADMLRGEWITAHKIAC